jgi:prepilin-type N-terminal cleavage/methylation domain-containing protein
MNIQSMYRPSRRRPAALPMARARRGFTLVELIVSLVILSVGLLALVGTSLTVTRQMSTSVKRTQAANIAETRFETMRSRNQLCSTMVGTSTRTWPRGVSEKWIVSTLTTPASAVVGINGAVRVTDTVTFSISKGKATKVAFQSVIPCYLATP